MKLTMEGLCVCLAMVAGLAAGCQWVEVDPPKRAKPLTPLPESARNARLDIARVVVMSEATAAFDNGRGVPDAVNVECFLFPSQGDNAVVGRGSFRFELYDANQSADPWAPFQQVNLNFDQSVPYVHYWKGVLAYAFRVPLGVVPPGVSQVYVKVRFFPEDGRPEAGPDGQTVTITSTLSPRAGTSFSRPPPGPASRPEIHVTTIRPTIRRESPASQPK